MRELLKSPLFIALAAAVLCVVTDVSKVPDHIYWNVWYKGVSRDYPQTRAMVLVSTDGGVPISSGSVAGSTAQQAVLVNKLVEAGADRIFLDFPAVSGIDPSGDTALQEAIRAAGPRLTMVNRAKRDPNYNRSIPSKPHFIPPPGTALAGSLWQISYFGFAESSTATIAVGRASVPSVARLLAPAGKKVGQIYPAFSMDPAKINVIDAGSVTASSHTPSGLAGKTVFVTSTDPGSDFAIGYFGHGRVPAAAVDISGAIGLAEGKPVPVGDYWFLAWFVAAVALGQRTRGAGLKLIVYLSLVGSLVFLPGILREYGLISHVGAAFIAMVCYLPLRSSEKWRHRVRLTSVASGLPNIEALSAQGIAAPQDVVAAAISQYDQMLASLPRKLHGECARQIARRLSMGARESQVFSNDSGQFVWLEETRPLEALVEQLEGLKALFASPLLIEGHVLDTNIHFGLDRNHDSDANSRIQSALASAGEALIKGKLYEEFGEQRLALSPWELSLHARIDEGLRNGDIWLALQPQYDFRSNRISGAEALIRWNDPQLGVIPPDAFILQAERAGRIETITYWVLARSIAMARELNETAGPFQISVNLSARLVDHPHLVQRVADIVRETGADCSHITFEVTETFSMANRDQAKINLAALRAMGFRLSIDDFGTGQASLAYLAEIPSDEIKLDRRFIQAVTTVERERQIVESVIHLAHALGQDVVAEGIEDMATLETLRRLGCDLAQGYYVGRPMRFEKLAELLVSSRLATGSG